MLELCQRQLSTGPQNARIEGRIRDHLEVQHGEHPEATGRELAHGQSTRSIYQSHVLLNLFLIDDMVGQAVRLEIPIHDPQRLLSRGDIGQSHRMTQRQRVRWRWVSAGKYEVVHADRGRRAREGSMRRRGRWRGVRNRVPGRDLLDFTEPPSCSDKETLQP